MNCSIRSAHHLSGQDLLATDRAPQCVQLPQMPTQVAVLALEALAGLHKRATEPPMLFAKSLLCPRLQSSSLAATFIYAAGLKRRQVFVFINSFDMAVLWDKPIGFNRASKDRWSGLVIEISRDAALVEKMATRHAANGLTRSLATSLQSKRNFAPPQAVRPTLPNKWRRSRRSLYSLGRQPDESHLNAGECWLDTATRSLHTELTSQRLQKRYEMTRDSWK